MTGQQIDRERLAEWRDQTAYIVEKYGNEAWAEIHANEVVAIIDALTQAEADRDWLFRSSRLAKEGRIKANARAERAESERDQARAQADRVRALLDRIEGGGYSAITTTGLRRALDGEQ